MSNGVLAFLKRMTTDQDFKTLVQRDPNAALSQFSLSTEERESLLAFSENPEESRKDIGTKSNVNYWF